MSEGKKYTVARYLSSAYDKDLSIANRYLMDMLNNMMDEMKEHLYSYYIIDYERNLRWIMTREVFNWIVCTCVDEYGFYYESQYNSIGENKCELYGIEVEFVKDELKTKNAEVNLTYVEPDNVTVSCFDTAEALRKAIKTWTCVDKSLGIAFDTFSKNIGKDIEVVKEKLMKSFYVGCGKKVTIVNVIFNNPATIVFWSDGTKTVVKRQKGDKKFDPEKGLAMAICKKVMGNKGNFNDIFREWIEED